MVSVLDFGQPSTRVYIAAATKNGRIYLASRNTSAWDSREVLLEPPAEHKPHQVLALSSLGLFIVATAFRVYVFSVENCEILYTVDTEQMKPRSLQCAYVTQRIAHVESPGITSSTVAYIGSESGDCVLHTFTPHEDYDSISLRDPSRGTDGEGCEWDEATVTKRRIKNPGHFNILSDGSIVGIRRKVTPEVEIPSKCPNQGEGLRNRFSARTPGKSASPTEWEVWTIATNGRVGADEEMPLFNKQENHLLIPDLGPRVRIGLMSVAFCFGNMIKMVTVGGPERFDSGFDETGYDLSLASRRRKAGNNTSRPRGLSENPPQ